MGVYFLVSNIRFPILVCSVTRDDVYDMRHYYISVYFCLQNVWRRRSVVREAVAVCWKYFPVILALFSKLTEKIIILVNLLVFSIILLNITFAREDPFNSVLLSQISRFLAKHGVLKLIICYISSGATDIAEVSCGFHQADWSTTLSIVYCYPISFLFLFICLLVYRNLILTISVQMKMSAQLKFALYINK